MKKSAVDMNSPADLTEGHRSLQKSLLEEVQSYKDNRQGRCG